MELTMLSSPGKGQREVCGLGRVRWVPGKFGGLEVPKTIAAMQTRLKHSRFCDSSAQIVDEAELALRIAVNYGSSTRVNETVGPSKSEKRNFRNSGENKPSS